MNLTGKKHILLNNSTYGRYVTLMLIPAATLSMEVEYKARNAYRDATDTTTRPYLASQIALNTELALGTKTQQ